MTINNFLKKYAKFRITSREIISEVIENRLLHIGNNL